LDYYSAIRNAFGLSDPELGVGRVLDIKMPRMDGMETLRRLREKSHLPVIFLTSKAKKKCSSLLQQSVQEA